MTLLFAFQFTKHTREKLNFPKLLFYSSPQDQKLQFGNTPITLYLPHK